MYISFLLLVVLVCLDQCWQTFSAKNQIVSILGLGVQMISVTATQLCPRRVKVAIDYI